MLAFIRFRCHAAGYQTAYIGKWHMGGQRGQRPGFDYSASIIGHGDALLGTPDSFKAFVDLNPAPQHVGLAIAPYHLQNIKASVEDVIRTAGSQLLFFYAWQSAAGINQLPGHGPADFVPWFRALAHINYQGFVNPFMHGNPTP